MRQAFEIAGDVVLAGMQRTVSFKPNVDFEPGGHLYCRQNEALVY